MNQTVLKVKKRETGKQINKQYRRDGLVPGVFYMNNTENVNILADTLSLRSVVYTPLRKVIDLHIEGESTSRQCVLKDITFHPVTDKIEHIDLLGIQDNHPVTVYIPFKMVGSSDAIRTGGKLQQTLLKVKVTCMPEFLQESIEVDISEVNVGGKLYVRDLKNVEHLKFHVSGDTAICMVTKPRVIKA